MICVKLICVCIFDILPLLNFPFFRFIHEEAIACELAGYFHAKQGAITKSHDLFEESYHAYMKWGAVKKANMLKPLMGKV